MSCLKETIIKFTLKFTLKQLRHVSVLQLHNHQGYTKTCRSCFNINFNVNFNIFSILCLTRDFIRQGHAREKEKCTAQPVRAARRSIEGNGRGEAVTSRRYGNCLTASKQGACTAQPVRSARRLRAAYGTRNRITSQA